MGPAARMDRDATVKPWYQTSPRCLGRVFRGALGKERRHVLGEQGGRLFRNVVARRRRSDP